MGLRNSNCFIMVLLRRQLNIYGFTMVLLKGELKNDGFKLVLLRVRQQKTIVLQWFCLGAKENVWFYIDFVWGSTKQHLFYNGFVSG